MVKGKAVERFYFSEILCEFVRVFRSHLSVNGIGSFSKIGLNLRAFSREYHVFMTFLCCLLYIICMNVVNTIRYVVNSGIHDVFVHSGG